MRVVVPPVLVHDRICRIVSPVESLLEVEEWVGEWWEPSGLTLSTVSGAPPVPEVELVRHGVPPSDWGSAADRTSSSAIEAMMLAHVTVRPRDLQLVPADGPARSGRRRKEYAGSARFRRGLRVAGKRATDRGDAPSAELKGPWRRSTDVPPAPQPDPASRDIPLS